MWLLRRREYGDRTSAIAHHACLLPVPIEIRPHVGAALSADLADETMLNVGQPDIIGPAIAVDRSRVAAALVGAIDKQPTHAHVAHLGEGDLPGRDRDRSHVVLGLGVAA